MYVWIFIVIRQAQLVIYNRVIICFISFLSPKGRKFANLIADNQPMFVTKNRSLVQQTRLGKCSRGASKGTSKHRMSDFSDRWRASEGQRIEFILSQGGKILNRIQESSIKMEN